MLEPIGFIGLGQLGLPMASNLIDAGHALRVYNRTASKADTLVARGAVRGDRPEDVVIPGGVVITVLWADEALESVVTGAFLERLGPGGVHVSMSTVLPETAERLAALHAAKGSTYLAAPVFGRPEAAVARKLWVPLAGPLAAKARVRPLLEGLGAQGVFDFGEAVSAGTVVKLAGNFLLLSAARSFMEALAMAEANGVDPKAVVHMLTTTLFDASIYRSYGKMIADKTVPPGISPIALKDVGLFAHTAAAAGAPTPIANRLLELLKGP